MRLKIINFRIVYFLYTFQIGGVIAVALGIWTVVDKSFANELLGTNLYSGSAYILIATGLLISLISCFGCFGSVKEVRCMLVTVIILLIYLLQLFSNTKKKNY